MKSMLHLKMLAAVAMVCGCLSVPSHAIVGVGVHWGIDMSLDMKDKFGETLRDLELPFSVGGFGNWLDTSALPDTIMSQFGNTLKGSDIPFYVNRFDWNNGNGRVNPIAFGGKVFVDVIPVIDAIEASFDFAMWEYQGQLVYPVGLKSVSELTNAKKVPDIFTYDTLNLSLKEAGMPSYFGLLDGTPYLKMHIDLTVRKNLVAVPKKLKVFRLYAGGGLNANIGTPVLSSGLIQDAITKAFDSTSAMLAALDPTNPDLAANQTELQKAIMNQILDNLNKVRFGAHIVVGTMIKIPIIPIGFYVDGKFMIPFGKLDDYVDIGGYGFLVNGGIALAF